MMERLQWPPILLWLIDANDALNKSYVDTQTNNLLKTD